MRNAGRKILALVLASLMILTLAACNKKQQLGTSLPEGSPDAHAVSDKLQETKTESPTAQTEEEFHWERVQTPLPDGESTIWAQAEAHGTVIAGTHKQLFALENGSWNELSVPDDFLYGNALCEDADGGFWFLYTTMNNSLAIARYGTDFAVQETFLTSCENEDQLYFQLLKTDGEFYLLSRERLVRLDENGALTVQDVDDTRDGRYFDSMAEVNGTLYVLAPTAFDNVEHSYDELRQLDPATLEETAVLLEKQGLCGMGADAEGRLVLSRAAGLFAFDPETGGEAEILTAIFSCAYSYEVIARKIVEECPSAPEHPMYGRWVRGYITPRYTGNNVILKDMLERLTKDYTEEQLRYLEEIFTACSRYEASFWDMADRFGTEGGVQA